MKRIAIMFCMVLSMTMTANAQTNGLTEGEEISIRERCDVMINDFQHYLEIIAGKGKAWKSGTTMWRKPINCLSENARLIKT